MSTKDFTTKIEISLATYFFDVQTACKVIVAATCVWLETTLSGFGFDSDIVGVSVCFIFRHVPSFPVFPASLFKGIASLYGTGFSLLLSVCALWWLLPLGRTAYCRFGIGQIQHLELAGVRWTMIQTWRSRERGATYEDGDSLPVNIRFEEPI